MFGRQSLRDFLRGENESLSELIRNQHEEFLDYEERRKEESREEFQRRDEEFREFMREITLRHERVYGPMIAEMEEGRKQIRANTEAVLSALDRLEGGAAA